MSLIGFHAGMMASSAGGAATTWNPADKGASINLSNGNLTAAGGSATWSSVRLTISKAAGKWYNEGELGGTISTTGCPIFGVCTAGYSLATHVGATTGGWGIQGTGAGGVIRTFLEGVSADLTGAVGSGGRVKCAIDIDAGKGWLAAVGGAWIGGGDPAAGTSPTFTFTAGTTLFFAAGCFDIASGTITHAANAYADTVPSGFSGIG